MKSKMLKQKLIGIVFSFLLVMMSQIMFAQNVSGKVTDSRDGDPLTGVSVLEVGTTNGTVTDIDGTYSLKLNSPSTVLVF
ncbi:MAG: carboxypeptidase-like regulatory domain-containing protein, partial [Saprospiraceae bacterium]